ncbi:hypothetical protein, partial [Chromobacterium violaceum]
NLFGERGVSPCSGFVQQRPAALKQSSASAFKTSQKLHRRMLLIHSMQPLSLIRLYVYMNFS